MSVQSFIFGPGQKYKTQEDLDRARAMVRDVYGNIGSPRTIGEGLSALGDGIMANVMNRRIAQGQGEFDKNRANADASFLNGMSGLSAPAFPQSVATGGSPTSSAPTGTQATSASSGSLPPSFLAALDKTEGGGNYDTLYGNAQRNGRAFSGTNVSKMPIKDVLAFSDPNGPYAQSVKSQIGRVATPMGRHQIVGTTLRNAVDQMGLDPSTPFDRNTQDAVAVHLARNRISSADTMQGKIAGLRSEWAGFRNLPDSELAKIIADFDSPQSASRPAQVASLDPSAGMEQAYAPPQSQQSNGAAQAINQVASQQSNYPEAGKVAPVDWTDQPQLSVAAGMQFANGQQAQGQQIAALPPQQPETPQAGQDGRLPGVSDAMLRANDQMMGGMFAPKGQQPVQVADNSGNFPPAPSMTDAPAQQPQESGNSLEFYARQLSNPFLSPENKKLAMMMYQQQMERQQQAGDPGHQLDLQYKQAQLDALKAKPAPSVRQLSPQEVQSAGLDPKKAYQQKSDGTIMEIGGSGVTVNLPGASEIGTIPQGYEAYKDEAGVRRMRRIPGGPEDNVQVQEAQRDAAKITTDTLSNATKNITGLISSGSFVTGSGGKLLSYLSTTDASELRRQVAVLKSNATIETLNAMRKQSPTGGALGNVTEGEGKMLAAKAGIIDPDSSAEQFQGQYKDYYKTLLRVINGTKVGDSIYEEMFPAQPQGSDIPAPEGIDPADWKFATPEERKLFIK